MLPCSGKLAREKTFADWYIGREIWQRKLLQNVKLIAQMDVAYLNFGCITSMLHWYGTDDAICPHPTPNSAVEWGMRLVPRSAADPQKT